MPRPCPALSRCLPAPRSISSLLHCLRSCLTPFRGHPLISSVPLGPARWHEALLTALPAGSGTQRHLRLTRTTSPRAQGGGTGTSRGLTATGTCCNRTSSAWAGRCLPPHQKQQNTRGERIPSPTCLPRAVQSRSGEAGGVPQPRRSSPPQRGNRWGTAPHPLASSMVVARSWETLKCHLHHQPEPAPNLHRSTRSNRDFPVPPVWDASPCDGTELPVIRSFSYQLLARTRADRPAPGSASAKPTNTQKRAGSPGGWRELLSWRGCPSCGAGPGPVTPIHSVPHSRNRLPSRPQARDKLLQPLVSGFRFHRQIWEEQIKQRLGSLLQRPSPHSRRTGGCCSPGSYRSRLPPPSSVPSASLSRSCQLDFSLPSSALRRLRPSAPNGRTLATLQRFGIPGFFLRSRMASLGPQLLQPPAPPAFTAGTRDL